MRKRILYPTDGSPTAKRALEFAVDIAKGQKAEIIVLSVIEKVKVGILLEDKETEDLLYKFGKEHVEEASGEIKKMGVEVRTLVVVADHAATEIVKIAEQENVYAIVMGTHGRSNLGRAILGSVALKVSQMAKCPVVLIPSKE